MSSPTEGSIDVHVKIAGPLLCYGVLSILAGESDMNICEASEPPTDGVPHVVIADWGYGLAHILGSRSPDAVPILKDSRILLLSTPEVKDSAELKSLHGIMGFVSTECEPDDLISAVRTVAFGSPYVCAEAARWFESCRGYELLTPRESQVLQLLARGECNKRIAIGLHIGLGTVKTHVKAIMGKLSAKSRTEATRIAVEHGLVNLQDKVFRLPPLSPMNRGSTSPLDAVFSLSPRLDQVLSRERNRAGST